MAHLTKEDRLRIENMLNAGVSATASFLYILQANCQSKNSSSGSNAGSETFITFGFLNAR